ACIERLQGVTGNASFNNLLPDARGVGDGLDFVAHARSLGAHASRVKDLAGLASALSAARAADGPTVLAIEPAPGASTPPGGHWWDVAVPEVSERNEVRAARKRYDAARRAQSDDG